MAANEFPNVAAVYWFRSYNEIFRGLNVDQSAWMPPIRLVRPYTNRPRLLSIAFRNLELLPRLLQLQQLSPQLVG